MTFADDGVADRVARRSHEICGHQVLTPYMLDWILLSVELLYSLFKSYIYRTKIQQGQCKSQTSRSRLC